MVKQKSLWVLCKAQSACVTYVLVLVGNNENFSIMIAFNFNYQCDYRTALFYACLNPLSPEYFLKSTL